MYCNKKRNICLFVLSVIIFGINIWGIDKLSGPYMFADEMGYWSHAANMAGLDWTGVLSDIPWYSYGYSLVLVPLFWVTHNMKVLYRIALLMNALFTVGIFLICLLVSKKLYKEVEEKKLITASFVVSLYSAYIVQSSIAWSESFLCFLVWLMFLLFIYFDERPSVLKSVMLGILIGFIYVVHNRMIVLFVAVAIIEIVMLCYKKIASRHMFATWIPIGMILFINNQIKDYLCYRMWKGNSIVGNDVAAMASRIEDIFCLEGICAFFQSISGVLFYLVVGSGFLVVFSAIYTIQRLKNNRQCDVVYIFIWLCNLGEIAVSTISTTQVGEYSYFVRLDHLMYGRYVECVTGILLLIGILYLFTEKRLSVKYVIINFILLYAVIVINQTRIDKLNSTVFNPPCAVGVYWTQYVGGYSGYKVCVVGIVFLLIIFGISMLKPNIKVWILSALYLAIFVVQGIVIINENVIPSSEGGCDAKLVNYLWEEYAEDDIELTCLVNSQAWMLQTRLTDQRVNYIPRNEIEDDDIVITHKKLITRETMMKDVSYGECVFSGEQYRVYQWDEADSEENYDIPFDMMYTQEGEACGEDIVQTGIHNNVIYGPYITIPEGEYIISAVLDTDEIIEGEKVCLMDLFSSDTVYQELDVISEGVDEQLVEIEFNTKSDVDNFEIRFMGEPNQTFRLVDLDIQRVSN